MTKKTSIIIGVAICFGFGFVSSSIAALKKSSRTLVAYAEYPLATDQWQINGKTVAIGRAFCLPKPANESWRVALVRIDGTRAEASVTTKFGLNYGFPFTGIVVSDPLPGYNAGLHIEKLSSSTLHQAEFTCK